MSAKLFAQRGNAREEGHSLNALGMQRARLGEMQKATEDLDRASALLADASTEYALTLNNLAATSLWRGAPNSLTTIQLQMARDLVKRPFDKIVVSLNEALFAILSGSVHPVAACERAERLLQHAQLPDRTLWRTFYWNRAFFLRQAGEANKADADLERLRSLNIRHRDVWAHRLNDEPVDDCYQFQLERGYVTPYLSKWHFSIDQRHPNGL